MTPFALRHSLAVVALASISSIVSACSSQPTADAGGDAFAPVDSAVDASGGDVPDDVATDVGCTSDASTRAPTISWSDGPGYPVEVDHHNTAIHTSAAGTFVYVFGGVRQVVGERIDRVYDDIRRARIAADGTLGAWEVAGRLPIVLGFAGMAETDERVYMAGGVTMTGLGAAASQAVLVADFGPDGMVTIRRGVNLRGAAVHPTLSVLGGRLVLVGGTDGRSAQARVQVSELQPDGINAPWTDGTRLPVERSHHSAVLHDGRLYLFGGFTGMPVGNMIEPRPEILASVRDASGAISDWQEVGQLDPAPSTHSSFEYEGSVYLVGGIEDITFVDRVRRAQFLCDGRVGPFVDVMSMLPFARSHVHQTPVFAGRVYSVGGRVAPQAISSSRTVVGRLQ